MAAEGECMAVANEEESLYEMYWLIIIIVFLFFFVFYNLPILLFFGVMGKWHPK